MTEPRTFASDTSVPTDRTRAEISKLLTDWQCAAIGWTDHLRESRVALEFSWHHDAAIYRVRMSIQIPSEKTKCGYRERDARYDQARKFYVRPLSAHRLLLLKLKADLNAARSGLARAEEIFLPWMVDSNGKTISDIILPQLRAQYALGPGTPTPAPSTTEG